MRRPPTLTKMPEPPASKQGRENEPRPATSVDGDETTSAKSLRLFHSAKLWMEIGLLILGVIAVPLAVKTWIEGLVEKSVQKTMDDETILRKIASHSRPALIFSGSGSILHDMGAAQYLKVD